MKRCRCGHPDGQHGLYPPHECFVHREIKEKRKWRFDYCGCEGFVEATNDAARTR